MNKIKIVEDVRRIAQLSLEIDRADGVYEKLSEAASTIEALASALEEIASTKPEPISDSGFSTGPRLLLEHIQRRARSALSSLYKKEG